MKKVKWPFERIIGDRHVYARRTRSEIVVRIQKEGDTSKYAEWGMPWILGIEGAMSQANSQTRDEDIRE
jgi:hypothetical protein